MFTGTILPSQQNGVAKQVQNVIFAGGAIVVFNFITILLAATVPRFSAFAGWRLRVVNRNF